jgi:hypothetical protein
MPYLNGVMPRRYTATTRLWGYALSTSPAVGSTTRQHVGGDARRPPPRRLHHQREEGAGPSGAMAR